MELLAMQPGVTVEIQWDSDRAIYCPEFRGEDSEGHPFRISFDPKVWHGFLLWYRSHFTIESWVNLNLEE